MKIRFAHPAQPATSALAGSASRSARSSTRSIPTTPTRASRPTTWAACRRGAASSTASSGTIVLDKEAGSGTLDVKIDADVDRLRPRQAEHARASGRDVRRGEVSRPRPTPASSRSSKNGAPTEVDGTLTLHGVTQAGEAEDRQLPVQAASDEARRKSAARTRPARSTATTSASTGARSTASSMDVKLQIQVEALKADRSTAGGNSLDTGRSRSRALASDDFSDADCLACAARSPSIEHASAATTNTKPTHGMKRGATTRPRARADRRADRAAEISHR